MKEELGWPGVAGVGRRQRESWMFFPSRICQSRLKSWKAQADEGKSVRAGMRNSPDGR